MYFFSFPLVATLLFVTGEKAIHHLFSRDTPYELGYAYVAMIICLNATLEKTIISGLQTLKLVRFCKKIILLTFKLYRAIISLAIAEHKLFSFTSFCSCFFFENLKSF